MNLQTTINAEPAETAEIFFRPRPDTLRRQVALAVVLQLFVAIVIGGWFAAVTKLSNDRSAFFSLFRDTLHSINVYGEYPWWNPSMPGGFPFYYTALLYWPGRDPLFALMAAVVWLLGRAHVTIGSYHLLYVAYFAFLLPLLLSLSALALARQIFRHPLAVYLVIVLMAFSPGVMFGMSDLGAEPTAYGLLLAAAVLRFLRTPDRASFALLCLAGFAAATVGYHTFFWNALFVPMFILLVVVGSRDAASRAVRAIPSRWWMAAVLGASLCALPAIVLVGHGRDIVVAPAAGEHTYKYSELRPGTPLEALAISTPGVGFEWTDYGSPAAPFQPRALSMSSGFMSYGYLGMLTLSMMCVGLIFGRPYWARRLYALVAIGIIVMLLAGYSPIFSLLLGVPSPLRSVNHYSDALFRVGLFVVFVLAAALGAESVLGPRRSRRWILAALFVLNGLISLGWLVLLQGRAAADNYVFGVAVAFLFLYGVALVWFARARTAKDARRIFVVLLCLAWLDTATLGFAHLKLSLRTVAEPTVEPGPDTLGSATHVKLLVGFLYLRGVDRGSLGPAFAGPQDVTITGRTYNRLSVQVNAADASRLEWRDAYFPFWRAWVNGAEVDVERTPQGLKAIRVPAGRSDVVFRFVPATLRATVAIGYLVLLAAAAACFVRTGGRADRISVPR